MKFINFLIENNHKKIYVDPCSGNNGDHLIWLGMLEVLSKSRSVIVKDVRDADLVIINGGGMFIDAYKQGINKVSEYSNRYPDKELCIAPNSFHFKTIDFGKVLDLRQSKLYIFSREKYSKSYIDSLQATRPLIKSYLDHDLAFNLKNSDFIASINKQYPAAIPGNILVVDRMDIEHASSAGKVSIIKGIYSFLVSSSIKSFIRKIRIKLRKELGTDFTKTATDILKNNNYETHKVTTMDISRIDVCSFEDFVRLIAEADYIFSNRLHVGVLGYLLGRNVYMSEGSYFKMTGIYEYSMKEAHNVNII